MIDSPIELCQEFVRTPSYSGQESAVMQLVAGAMQRNGFDEVRQDPLGAVTGVKCGGKPRGTRQKPVLMFDIHTDVVEVTDPGTWEHDPFGAEIAAGRLYGRGACDIKGGLASTIAGVGSLSAEDFCGEVWVTATTHEEDMEGAVSRAVVAHRRPDYCVVVEPTMLRVGWIQKGRGSVVLHTQGKAAHTSTPEVGVNAIYKMLPAIEAIRKMERRSHPVLGKEVIEMVEVISEPFPGGVTVPIGCSARFDCRLLPGETQQTLIDRFQDAVGEGVNVEIRPAEAVAYTGERLEQPDFHVGWALTADNPFVTLAQAAVQQAGGAGGLYAIPFCSNASAISQAGVPTIILGPGNIEQAHTRDEWVSIPELEQAASVYALLVKNLLKLE